jgi:glycosyltransferase involved in cell wall biosynthesis
MPDAEFHIYGEGPDRPLLAALIAESQLEGRVVLHHRLPLEEIAPVMATADAGIIPKRADGFGNEAFSTKILEFMACAVPVIVSRTQVDAYYFDDTFVRFFTSGNEHDLATALLEVYGDRARRAAKIELARDFAVRHSWQERGADYHGLIGSLLSRSRSAPLHN